jgi:hypothetical protein
MDITSLCGLAAGLPNARRLRLDVDALNPSEVPAGVARLLLNLLLLAAESLPAGGTITLAGDPASDVLIRIEGQRAAWPKGLAAMLKNETAAWAALEGPRTLQGPLTVLTAHDLGLGLSMLIGIGQAQAAPPILLTVRR